MNWRPKASRDGSSVFTDLARSPGASAAPARFWKPARRAEIIEASSHSESPRLTLAISLGFFAPVGQWFLPAVKLRAQPGSGQPSARHWFNLNRSAASQTTFSSLHLSQLIPTTAASINDPLVTLSNGARAGKGRARCSSCPSPWWPPIRLTPNPCWRQLIATKTCDDNLRPGRRSRPALPASRCAQ